MTVDDIALTLHRGLGPKGVAHLIAVLGSAQAVYAASEEELVGEAALRPDLARDIRRRTTHRQAEANRLIMAHSAAMVCSGDDVVRELGWDIVRAGQIPERKPAAPLLDGDERRVLEAIGEGETVDTDTLAVRSGIPAGALAAVLLGLELAGMIRSLPGRRYERV